MQNLLYFFKLKKKKIKDIKKIIWKEDYNIGQKEIDKEHEGFFILAQKLYSIYTIKDENAQIKLIKNILNKLYKYVSIHFSNEEIFMSNIKYPQLNEHILIHKNMLKSLNYFVLELHIYNIYEMMDKLYYFVENTFINHIKTEDIKITQWYKEEYEEKNPIQDIS